ncbi:NmrA/HSCARG family protein [Rhodococcoides fascians]|uniref:NmrA/HSCARG family protein n=1 Tax=Rhodococcoides fascians TaxID=1828 RepID=UPI00068E99D0|nr:NmrA/HSCARG family protein [Rhodococcus fascians]
MDEQQLTRRKTASDRVITVLGATGQQGGSVATALLEAGWRVRAVVRDPSSSRARRLEAAGIETATGDLGDPASLRSAFTGAHGVFSVQPSSGQAGSEVTDDDEVAYGISVADTARDAGVEHLVYSSAIAAGPTSTGIAHFDTKSRIEEHIEGLDICSTIVRPASFMEILLLPGMGLAGGRFSFLMDNEQPMQFIAVRDIGSIVGQIFSTPNEFAHRTLDIAGDALTGHQLAQHFSVALGRPIDYQRMNPSVLERDDVLSRLAAAVDDGRLAGHADLTELRQRFPFLLRFGDWLASRDAGSIATAGRPVMGDVELR